MGQVNCKNCDCGHLLRNASVDLVAMDKAFHKKFKKQKSRLDVASTASTIEEESPSKAAANALQNLTKIQALWRGFRARRLYAHLKRTCKPNHAYFSLSEVKETLSKFLDPPSFREKRRLVTYKDGSMYTGEWRGGFRDGYGLMIYVDGARYDGNWDLGRPRGKGRFTMADGQEYSGMWKSYWIYPEKKLETQQMEDVVETTEDGYCKIYVVWIYLRTEMISKRKHRYSVISEDQNSILSLSPIKVANNYSVSQSDEEIVPPSIPNASLLSPITLAPTSLDSNPKLQDLLHTQDEIEQRMEFALGSMNNLSSPTMHAASNRKFVHLRDKEGNIYIGETYQGVRDGRGKYIYCNGDIYEGGWINDKKEGLGKSTWIIGSSFFGWHKEDQKDGIGEYKWENGSSYIGEWRKDKMQGHGKFIWQNGRMYVGAWYNGQMHGFGYYTWGNGKSYLGNFVRNRRHGEGLMASKSGNIVKGIWRNGKCVQELSD